jgi:hypothetical protein
MLVRPPDKILAAEKRRARNRVLLREHRERAARNLAIYHVAVDGEMLNKLIRDGYITDSQVDDWTLVNAALSKFLWNQSH